MPLISMPIGGLSGATIIDSLDTLYLMELQEEFQEAKAWVEENFHLNVVSQRPLGYWSQKVPGRSVASSTLSLLRPRAPGPKVPSRAVLEMGLRALSTLS